MKTVSNFIVYTLPRAPVTLFVFIYSLFKRPRRKKPHLSFDIPPDITKVKVIFTGPTGKPPVEMLFDRALDGKFFAYTSSRVPGGSGGIAEQAADIQTMAARAMKNKP